MELAVKIEAILFWKGEPMTIPELTRLCKVPSGEVKQALRELEEKQKGRGIALIRTEHEVSLATSPDVAELIQALQKEELARDLGRAALETLAIVLYRAPISRREIDYIRGVNSTAILRSLLIRGLIERVQSEKDERMFLYQPTVLLLSYLGVGSVEELPEYKELGEELIAWSEAEKGKTTVEEEPETLE